MLAAPLVCVVGFQNSERNKGAKRRRNNRTLTGLCVAIREGWGWGNHPSCSLYFSKPSLTYPSIIEKATPYTLHVVACVTLIWKACQRLEQSNWSFLHTEGLLMLLLLFLLQQLPFRFMYGSCQLLCGPVTQTLSYRLYFDLMPQRKQLSPPTSEYGRIPTVNKTCSEID